MKLKRTLRLIVFLALGLGFIWWFIAKLTRQEIDELFLSFSNANYYWFALAILIGILSIVIRSFRWQQLIRPMGYNPKFLPTFLSISAGYLANLAVPRLGEVLRCGLLNRTERVPIEKAIGTVVIERFIDTLLFFIILFLSLLLEFNYIKDYIYNNFGHILDFGKWKYYLLYMGIGAFILVLIFLLFRKRIIKTKLYIKILDIVKGIFEGIKSIFNLKNPFLFIVNSLLIWFLWILGTYIIFLCFDEMSHLSLKIAVITTVLGAIGPILTPGGIGIYPAIIAETLAIYLIAKPIGYAAGWLLWIGSQIGNIGLGLWGFIYFSYNKHNNERNRKNRE